MANLPPEERHAFFSLMDEYFASRPHLRPGGTGSAGGAATPVAAAAGAATAKAKKPAPPPPARRGQPGGAAVADPAPEKAEASDTKSMVRRYSVRVVARLTGQPPQADYYTAAAAADPPPPQYTGPSETGGARMAVALYTYVHQALRVCICTDHGAGVPASHLRFQGSEANDLPVQQGEQIELLEAISDDWWRARSTDGSQREGIVPANYIQLS